MVHIDDGRHIVFTPPGSGAVTPNPFPSYGCSAADVEVGIAHLMASIGRCRHENAVPVDLSTGETVAWLCPDPNCSAQLPAGWGRV